MTNETEDRELLERYGDWPDAQLSRAFLAAEQALTAHRKGASRTRDKAHERIDGALAGCKGALADALAEVRHLAATRSELSPTDLTTVGVLWALARDETLAEALHESVDAPARPRDGEPFVAVDAEAWQAERDRLAARVDEIARVRALRELGGLERQAGRRRAVLEGVA